MTLEYACIMPHGGEIIPDLATHKTGQLFQETTKAARTIAKDIKRSNPRTIIIASPHNLRLQNHIAVVTTESSSGELRGAGKRKVSLKLKCDREFAKELLRESTKQGLPVVGANYGTVEGPASDMAMDWGTLVPLWFVAREERVKARIVVVAPSREIPLGQNISFGRVLARLAERKKNHRVVFIASADQAHAHQKSGPYGFHRAAAKYDNFVSRAIRENRIGSISRLTKRFVEDAKPDSLWQIAMLVGVTQVIKMRGSLLSYQVPTYYGMICASFHRV
jgi:aromatic ring-opening dioxygenase LigB subunit